MPCWWPDSYCHNSVIVPLSECFLVMLCLLCVLPFCTFIVLRGFSCVYILTVCTCCCMHNERMIKIIITTTIFIVLSSTAPATCESSLWFIWAKVGREVTIRLVLVLVISKIDYCNSALADMLKSTIAPLHRMQNVATCLVFELRTSDHVTASLFKLHWFPVPWRIKFKLCCIMHLVSYGRCSAYLSAAA